jgi:hypothetical protein
VTFKLTSGDLPPGLMLDTDGTLSGTPTTSGTYSGTVTASNGLFASDSQDFDIPVDVTAPTTTASATAGGNPYTFGDWTNQIVTVTLSATDGTGSGVDKTFYTLDGGDPTPYTGSFSVSSEGSHPLTYWSTDKATNSETPNATTVNLDLTQPTISGTATTGANGNDWYNTAVTIRWTCGDSGGSGIASCPSDQSISGEGTNQTVEGTATDGAGNTTVASSSPGVNIDTTDPTVTYSGNQTSYTVDQQINITCTADDALSAIASTDCQDITGPAASFAPGLNTITSTATDNAGNTGSGSVSFTIGVTTAGLCDLSGQYIGNSRAANLLCFPLRLVQLADVMHNRLLKASAILMYSDFVNVQRGHGLTNQQANTLIALARSL